jgi:transposase
MKHVAGIDVGKRVLDVSLKGESVQRYENTVTGRSRLADGLRQKGVVLVVCEATGGYEHELVLELQDQIPVHVAHPNKVRAYAQAVGRLAKTDRLDAEVIRRYGEHLELPVWEGLDPQMLELRALWRRRQQLVGMRSEEKNRLEHGSTESVLRHIAWLDEEIRQLELASCHLLAKVARLSHQAELYRSVRGIGEQTAIMLLSELPELGKLTGPALTALVGLAPWSHDSGKHRGYRAIRGGRAGVRKALYMSALSAIRYDSVVKSFYLKLRKRGKPGKVALVAVMRKLLLMLNAVAKRGTPWVEKYGELAIAA